MMGISLTDWAHLMEDNGHARAADLPSCFATREAAANDVNGFYLSHGLPNSAAMALRGGGGLSRRSPILSFLSAR